MEEGRDRGRGIGGSATASILPLGSVFFAVVPASGIGRSVGRGMCTFYRLSFRVSRLPADRPASVACLDSRKALAISYTQSPTVRPLTDGSRQAKKRKGVPYPNRGFFRGKNWDFGDGSPCIYILDDNSRIRNKAVTPIKSRLTGRFDMAIKKA